MENKNLRNVLTAAGLAVFAGVLTLGVNAAFGLDVPSQDPAGAALHSPVFNSVDVQGGLANSADDLTIYDDAIVNGGLTINPVMGGIFVTGNLGKLPLNANLWVGGKNYQDANSVTIDGDTGEISAEEGTLTIKNILDMQGGIKNTTVVVEGVSNVPKPVKIDDDFQVTGNGSFFGDLFATQNLTVTNNANITNNLNVSGNASISKDLTVSKSIDVGSPGVDGKLSLKGGGGKIMTKGTTNGGVNFDNPIVQTGWIGGDLAFGDYTALNSGYAWTGSEPISVVAGQNGVFFSKGNNGTAYQTQLGKIDTSGNLNMTGNITANKIGNFVDIKSINYGSLPANDEQGAQKTVSCPAGYTVLSCGHNVSYWDGSAYVDYKGSGITVDGLIPKVADGACVGHFVNKTASTKYVKAYAVCFNPSVNN